MNSDLLKMFPTNYSFTNRECMCVCEQDLALNNLQGLICHKTKPTNQPTNLDNIYISVCKLIVLDGNTW